jgi:hypothetical protein
MLNPTKIQTTKLQKPFLRQLRNPLHYRPRKPSAKLKQSKFQVYERTAFVSQFLNNLAQRRLAAEEKEKRRLRDQRLKEQKQTSKKAAKSKEEEKGAIDKEVDQEADNDTAVPEATKTGELPKLLPQDFLQQYAKEEKAEKKRMHLSAKDFEKMAEEEELKEQKQNSKKRHLSQGRQVG